MAGKIRRCELVDKSDRTFRFAPGLARIRVRYWRTDGSEAVADVKAAALVTA